MVAAVRTPPRETRQRVIDAASGLFAERGFHGTTARDIAERAGVNLAAAHYHFGSKESLYLEVLRAQFDTITATLERRGARLATVGARPTRAALEGLLRARVLAMLELLLGPPLAYPRGKPASGSSTRPAGCSRSAASTARRHATSPSGRG